MHDPSQIKDEIQAELERKIESGHDGGFAYAYAYGRLRAAYDGLAALFRQQQAELARRKK